MRSASERILDSQFRWLHESADWIDGAWIVVGDRHGAGVYIVPDSERATLTGVRRTVNEDTGEYTDDEIFASVDEHASPMIRDWALDYRSRT